MTTLYITLEVISPLSIRADHATTRSGSSDYIPGNTLLGCLAMIHRLLSPGKTKEFERFFLHGEIQYSNLYPARSESEEIDTMAYGPVYPLPKTAQCCKIYKNFHPLKGDDSDGHGVRDSLADWALFQLAKSYPLIDPLKVLQDHKTCNKCGEPLHHFDAYYRRVASSENLIQTKNTLRIQTRTGIDRDSGAVREGILYNREVFDEGSKFWGEIRLPADLEVSFSDFLEKAKGSFMRMGTGRTRGMGKVAIDFKPNEKDTEKDIHLNQRIEKLDDLIHKKIKDVTASKGNLEQLNDLKQLKEQFFFALTLHSPAILTDEFLRYHRRIDENVLCELLNIEKSSYGLQACYTNTSTKRITGWQELWGTPRTNEFAIDTGSVFLFQCHRGKRDELTAKLFDLEEQGVGKRRAEGFGRICISDPFHLRDEQK